MRVRTAIADSDTSSTRQVTDDLDYLAACLHGRRSRMAEGERLTGSCRIRSFSEFTGTIFPESEPEGILDFQRLLVYELARELSGFLAHVSGAAAALMNWVLVRFQVENLKVLIRFYLTKPPKGDPQAYVVPLPKELVLGIRGLSAAESLEDLARLIPRGLLRKSLEDAIEIYRDHRRPFFFEAALDSAYFQTLLARVKGLSREDNEVIVPMVCQEVDIFHLMLIVRGKFHYGLTPESLLPLHVQGTRIPRALFAEMVNDQDLSVSVSRVTERVFDAVHFEDGSSKVCADTAVDTAALERLAWKRFLRLANLAFRQSHIGLGAIVGYAGIRRIEVANLITISEGIRKGMAPETIRARLITHTGEDGAHV